MKPNRARKAKAWARNYGKESEAVRLMRCVVGCGCSGPIEVAHDPSRGAGGGRFDIGPLCKLHHFEQGTIGIHSFQDLHGLNLRELWDEIALGHAWPLGLVTIAFHQSTIHPLTDYERDALIGWTRRAVHRGLDVESVASALDIREVHARDLIDLAA
jgi:hypothetical protein